MDIRLNNLESLHWLWVVAGLAGVMLVGFNLKRRDLGRFADHDMQPRLLPYTSRPRQYVRSAMVVAALVLLVAAMIDPRWGVSYRQVQQRGIDLVVVLDVSRSMLAEDARPTRLARAKQYIDDLVERLNGDRVALVTFAGTAQLKCPLTVDYTAFRLALATAGPQGAPRGGSLLGDALRLAREAFTDEILDHKAVVVFSDGEDHGSDPLRAARMLFDELAVPVYTVGIGDSIDGARIPVERDGVTVWLTHQDEEVWSKMDAAGLRDIALATGGAFVPVGVGTVDMGHVYRDRIEPVAKREFKTATVRRHDPQFQWFAGAALALLLIESLIGDRRSARHSIALRRAAA